MKQAVALCGVLFAVVLAIVVGQRLSTEAMAVVVGVACGVVASVPVSLGLLLLLGRLPVLRGAERAEAARRDMPPVVVVTPGASQPTWPGYGSPTPWPMNRLPGQERAFHIIGEDGVQWPSEGKRALDGEGDTWAAN